MISFGFQSTVKRFNCIIRNKSLTYVLKKYHTNNNYNNRKYFDMMIQQSFTSRKSSFNQYSTTTIGFIASSLLFACSIIQSNEVSSCDKLLNDNNTNIDPLHDTAMYPPIKPYEKSMLVVSDIHSIAYSVYGNPNGKPVLGKIRYSI